MLSSFCGWPCPYIYNVWVSLSNNDSTHKSSRSWTDINTEKTKVIRIQSQTLRPPVFVDRERLEWEICAIEPLYDFQCLSVKLLKILPRLLAGHKRKGEFDAFLADEGELTIHLHGDLSSETGLVVKSELFQHLRRGRGIPKLSLYL